MNIKTKNAALSAALVGIMAATIECAKLALAAIPNVEAVSILIAVYSYVFGALGVLASIIFVAIEPLIWGFGTWIISYIIYWPSLALVFWALGKMKIKKIFIITGAVGVMTLLFGVISSAVDVGLFSGSYDNFLYRFYIYYIRGVWFYLTQLITNLVLFPILFKTVTNLLFKIKSRVLS